MDMAVADKVVVAGIAVVDHTLVADTLVAAAVDHMVEEDIVGTVVHKVVADISVVGLVVVDARFHLVAEIDKVVRFWVVVARC